MPFLALSDGSTTLTVRVKSNAAEEKYNEHGLDRERMFDGSMRQVLRGRYRQWNCTSTALTQSASDDLCALLTSSSLPLSATGDLVQSTDGVAVMPILISNNPIHTAGGWRRQVVFTLHETTQQFPVDTTATPWLFWRRGTGMFSDDAASTPAGDGDRIHVWQDQSGNDRDGVNDGGLFHNSNAQPLRDGSAAKFLLTSGVSASLNFEDLGGLTDAELMVSVKADADPSASDGVALIYRLGSDSFYPKTDGHIVDGFGIVGSGVDWGDPTEDLTEWNVLNPSASATLGYTGRLNNVVKATAAHGTFTFGLSGGAIGNVSGSGYFTGWIRDIVIFPALLTTRQRASWHDYLRGAVDDPPLA